MAMQFHRDKHSFSAKLVKEGATLRFMHLSEAYEVLIDVRKRADYNFHCSCPGAGGFSSRYSYGYGYQNKLPNSSSSSYNYSGYGKAANNGVHFLTTRAFLLNAAFVGILLGGTVIIDMSREALWKMQNPGKPFEEAMESIEKAKSVDDNS